MGGSAVWPALPPPLATWLPQKTVGAMPRPKRAMTDRVAPMWVQPLGGSRGFAQKGPVAQKRASLHKKSLVSPIDISYTLY